MRGVDAVQLDTPACRKRELELKIKDQHLRFKHAVSRQESQNRIAAIRRKLSNQANDLVPEAEVPGILKARSFPHVVFSLICGGLGAPAIAQSSGVFCAGNPVVPCKGASEALNTEIKQPVGPSTPIEVNDTQNDNEAEWTDAQPRDPPKSVITATVRETQEPPPPGHGAKFAEAPGEDEEVLDSVSEAVPTTTGNPYWKNLGCIYMHMFCYSFKMNTVLIWLLRMRRYFTPKAGGLKCSAEALQMWKDPKQRLLASQTRAQNRRGGELTKLFLQHGNFNDMEIAVKKRHTRQNSQKKEGGWFTKQKLENAECWTKNFGSILLR